MNALTRKLIVKELHVNRWLIASSSICALLGVLLANFGRIGFNVGALSWLTAIIAVGVMLVLNGVLNERKENTLLFVLSLPLSYGDYVRAKLLGLTLCFVIPWLLSSLAVVALVLLNPDFPDGLLPYTVLLCVFLLANFTVLLSSALHVVSEALVTAAIVITNMGVSLYIFTITSIAGIQQHMSDPTPVWNTSATVVLAIELAVLALAFTLPFVLVARRRDSL